MPSSESMKLVAPTIPCPPEAWVNYRMPPTQTQPSTIPSSTNVALVALYGGRALEELPLAPEWALPPILQLVNAGRIPFLNRLDRLPASQYSLLCRAVKSETNKLWEYDRIFSQHTPQLEKLFRDKIETSIPPVLYRCKLSCVHCRKRSDIDSRGKSVSYCLFAFVSPPEQDEDGVWSVAGSCVRCTLSGRECRIKTPEMQHGQLSNCIRFVIDPLVAAPEYLPITREESSDDEEDASQAEIHTASVREAKRKRVRYAEVGSQGGVPSDGEPETPQARRASHRRKVQAPRGIPPELANFQFNLLSVEERDLVRRFMEATAEREDRKRRVEELEDENGRLAAELVEKTEVAVRVPELEQSNRNMEKEIEELKAKIVGMAQPLPVKNERVSLEPSGSRSSQIPPQGQPSTGANNPPSDLATPPLTPQNNLVIEDQHHVPSTGKVALAQCAIFIDRANGKPTLVGQFEHKDWTELVNTTGAEGEWLRTLVRERVALY